MAYLQAEVIPTCDSQGWHLEDTSFHRLPILPAFAHPWELLALSGGSPIRVVAEWDGRYLRPLAVWSHQKLIPLFTL